MNFDLISIIVFSPPARLLLRELNVQPWRGPYADRVVANGPPYRAPAVRDLSAIPLACAQRPNIGPFFYASRALIFRIFRLIPLVRLFVPYRFFPPLMPR